MKEVERRLEEAKKIEYEDMEDDVGKSFRVIQGGLGKIGECVSREVGGKISVTRGDQLAVREKLLELYNEFFGVMMRQRELERENTRLKGELERKRNSRTRGMMTEGEESQESEWREVRRGGGRQPTSYAGVVRGGMSEREMIKGRVVVAGKGGWRTPPTNNKKEEAIVVSKREEKDSRKLAKEIEGLMKGKEIGGAPKAVRTIRDGKLILT